jgi:hypothetical protein
MSLLLQDTGLREEADRLASRSSLVHIGLVFVVFNSYDSSNYTPDLQASTVSIYGHVSLIPNREP